MWEVIYEYCPRHKTTLCSDVSCQRVVLMRPNGANPANKLHVRSPLPFSRLAGLMLLALGLGGITGPMVPEIRMETAYILRQIQNSKQEARIQTLPKSAPVVFEPLLDADGNTITPVNTDFSLVIPKIGVNAPVIANVDPASPSAYREALVNGVAHASTSFTPDQDGTVYLFSHSTNYEWFVKDLNAVFYLVKNLEKEDTIVLFYKGTRYAYHITDKQVVAARKSNFLIPDAGRRSLILQTCWPPGSTSERLLIFADLVDSQGIQI